MFITTFPPLVISEPVKCGCCVIERGGLFSPCVIFFPKLLTDEETIVNVYIQPLYVIVCGCRCRVQQGVSFSQTCVYSSLFFFSSSTLHLLFPSASCTTLCVLTSAPATITLPRSDWPARVC